MNAPIIQKLARLDPLTILALLIFFSALVAKVASWFHRSPATWFLVAMVSTPLLGIILLFLAGDPVAAKTRREKEERLRELYPGRRDIGDIALNEMNCPECGATVNPVTSEGL